MFVYREKPRLVALRGCFGLRRFQMQGTKHRVLNQMVRQKTEDYKWAFDGTTEAGRYGRKIWTTVS